MCDSDKRQDGAMGGKYVTRDKVIEAVEAELLEYFRGTEVQGLMESEACFLAEQAWLRATS